MPGFDGTGPMGQGPMTGGGKGYCAFPIPDGMRYFGPRGFGKGCGWGKGMGRGFGFRRAGYPYVYGNPYASDAYAANVTSKQEADMLRTEAKAMQEEINAINQRIKELELDQASKDNE